MSRQRIISMTSKGVHYTSRPFLSARVFLYELGCEWRLRATPAIVLIQPYHPPPPPFTSQPSPRSLFLYLTRGGGWPSSVIHPPTRDPLLKHDFRRQTKRASVVYNEARSFVSSPLFQASSPSSTSTSLCSSPVISSRARSNLKPPSRYQNLIRNWIVCPPIFRNVRITVRLHV